MKYYILLILIAVLSILEAQANFISIGENDKMVNLNQDIQYLRFEDHKLTFDQAIYKLKNGEFEKSQSSDPLNFGYDFSDFWFYANFKVENNLERVINIPYPYHQNLDLYVYSQGNWKIIESGNLKKFSTRGAFKPENFAWEFNFTEGDSVEVLVNIKSKSPVIMSMNIQSVDDFVVDSSSTNLFYGIFYGILFVMVMYNVFLYIIIGDRAYIYYIILVLANIAVFASVSGYAFKYFYPNNPEINYYIREFLIAFLIIPTSLFAISFLELKRHNTIFYYVLMGMVVLGSFICAAILTGFTFGFASLVVSVHAPLLLIIGLVTWYRGNFTAFFYTLAWAGYLIGGTAMTLRNRGLVAANLFTDHGAELGAVLDVFLLALALAYRYKKIRNEKSQLQKENIDLIEKQNILLEHKVKERTKMLNSTLEIVQGQFDEITNKNIEITSSMNYAMKIQESMFPDQESLNNAFNKVMLFYRPKETVSGDFLFFESIGEKLFIAVVDCTGHGVPGALMSMVGFNLFYDAINVEKLVRSNEILDYVERNLNLRLNQSKKIVKDGMEVALCILDTHTRELRFCGAQRPLLIVDEDKTINLIKGTKKAIGGNLENLEEKFEEHIITLNKRSNMFLYSDGFQDQFGGEQNKKYLSSKLITKLTDIAPYTGEKQEQLLADIFDNWKRDNEQVDDVLVVGVSL